MAAPLTNFQAGGEDLSDIYVDQTTVTTSGDFLFPESSFSDEGISAVFGRAIWSFGGNNDGQLGQQDRINRSSPVLIGLLSNWKQITSNGALAQFGEPGYGAAAWNHFAAVKSDGTMWVWGSNNAGRLGLNDALISRSSPVQIGSLTNWKQVAANAYSCMAINNSGSMWAWGRNARGQLGDNSTVNRSSPVQIGTLTDWKQVEGWETCAAIKTDGTIWSWGRNQRGQLGANNTANRSSPAQVGTDTDWKIVGANGDSTFAVKTNGTLWAWGLANAGRLGLNTTINRSSPTQIGSLTIWDKVSPAALASFATTKDGALWALGGENTSVFTRGLLGLNDSISRSSPVQIGTLTDWKNIAGGFRHCLAIKTDGSLWGWGSGADGRLGLNATIHRSSPIQIGTLTNWRSIAPGYSSSLARKV